MPKAPRHGSGSPANVPQMGTFTAPAASAPARSHKKKKPLPPPPPEEVEVELGEEGEGYRDDEMEVMETGEV